MKKVLALMTVLFFLSAPNAYSQICNGDFDFDNDVDGTDAVAFKNDFWRKDCPDDGPAPVPKTGQTSCYDEDGYPRDCAGTGEDGDLEKGVTWPNPRFTIIYCDTNGPCSDQGSDCDADPDTDVVTDNLTGLMWTRNANMFGTGTWQEALNDCNNLDFAGYDDWRLPNRFELESLFHLEYSGPAVPNTEGTGQCSEGDPFTNLVTVYYWSSTTYAYDLNYAWLVRFYYGYVNDGNKSSAYYVRAVRAGQ